MSARTNRHEDALQRAVWTFLGWTLPPNAVAFAVPNGGARSRTEAAIMKGMGVVPGVSDIIVVHDSCAFAIELKYGRGKQTADQIEWEKSANRAGIPYAVCYSVDDVEEFLIDQGVPLKTRRSYLERFGTAEGAREFAG